MTKLMPRVNAKSSNQLPTQSLAGSTMAGKAPGHEAGNLVYAVGAPHCAPPSVHWFSSLPSHTLKVFADLKACQAALRNRPFPQLMAILVGAQTNQVVDFVYQVRSDPALVSTQLLLLADEPRLIELMSLLSGVAAVDFAAPASSAELLQQRIAHLLSLPAVNAVEENSPIRLQIVDSVMSRLINSRRRSEAQLSCLQQLLELATEVVMTFDEETLLGVYGNQRAALVYGLPEPVDWSAVGLTDLLTATDLDEVDRQLKQLKTGQEMSFAADTLMPGDVRMPAQLSFMVDEQSRGLFVLSRVFVDETLQPDSEFSRSSHYDLLTRLPNRNSFLEQVGRMVASLKNGVEVCGLMVMDLNDFKEVNDSLGYAGGDQLLCQVGQRLSAVVAKTDMVSRLGDDDFAVLFSGVQNRQLIRDRVNKIAQEMQRPFIINDQTVEIGVAIGIAHFPGDAEDAQALLRHAELAASLAKRDSLGIVAFEQQQGQANHDQLRLKVDLRDAINGGQLFLHYQPKVTISDGRCVGVEALARWVHPQRGFIPPDEFVALAERAGLIKNLTRWVITEAVEQAARWRAQGRSLCVAINLSARNLQEPDLVTFVKNKLAEFSLPTSLLQFELTESDIMADPTTAIAVIDELHGLGIEFAVDDYGTGYSSLAYLKKLRISELKIDRGFISQLNCAGDDMVIVHSTITMAHQLGIRVVAEGVEDQEIWDLLEVLECDIAQGYLISRPVSAEDLEVSLEQREASLATH